MSLDMIGFAMARTVYQNSPRTLAAASAAWATARTFSKLGLDPKTTFIFTTMASVIYYGTKPLFGAFEESIKSGSYAKSFSRVAALEALTFISKDCLKLDLPLYGPLIKARSVAAAFIALFDLIDGYIPSFGGKQASSEFSRKQSSEETYRETQEFLRKQQQLDAPENQASSELSRKQPSANVDDKLGNFLPERQQLGTPKNSDRSQESGEHSDSE